MLEAMYDLPGLMCIADDIVIHGKDRIERGENLKRLLDGCKYMSIKFNREKLELRMKEFTFMGHKITSEGLKVDPGKVGVINDMTTTQSRRATSLPWISELCLEVCSKGCRCYANSSKSAKRGSKVDVDYHTARIIREA